MRKILMFLVVVLFTYCSQKVTQQVTTVAESDTVINLKWYQNYPSETQEHVATGLKWILSYLGAMEPERAIQWQSESIVRLDIRKAGFNKAQEEIWEKLLREIKSRTNYKNDSFLDAGLFSLLTFNNSWHYYALTEVSPTFTEFKEKYDFENGDEFIVAKGESCVSKGVRKLVSAKANEMQNVAHFSIEGKGEELASFKPEEFEVFDYMPNGQTRFAIYDLEENLITAAKEDIGIGGKPAKCMWCHTSKISKLLFVQTETEGYKTIDEYSGIIKRQNNLIWQTISKTLKGNFIAEQAEEHSYAELLYLGYEEPTFYRLRKEGYGIELEKWKTETHTNEEYKFMDLKLDSVISRKKIDPSFKMTGREDNKDEVNFLTK